RTKPRSEAIVAHCKVLCVIPERSDRVAVKVSHDVARLAGTSASVADKFNEFVNQAGIVGLLLVSIVVVLVAGRRVRPVKPERGGRIRILSYKPRGQAVYRRRILCPDEPRFSRRIRRDWVGAKVMVKRYILLEYHNQVANRGLSARSRSRLWKYPGCYKTKHCTEQQNSARSSLLRISVHSLLRLL